MLDWILKVIGHRWAWLRRLLAARAREAEKLASVQGPGYVSSAEGFSHARRERKQVDYPCSCGARGLHACPIPNSGEPLIALLGDNQLNVHPPAKRSRTESGLGYRIIEYPAGSQPPQTFTCHFCRVENVGYLPLTCTCGATCRSLAGSELVHWELPSQSGAYDLEREARRLSLELDTFASRVRAERQS